MCSNVDEQGHSHCRIVCGSKRLEKNVTVHQEGPGNEVQSVRAAGRHVAVKSRLRDDRRSRQHNRVACSICVHGVRRRDGHIDPYGLDLMAMKDLAIGVPSREGTGEERREIYFLLSIQLYYLLLLLHFLE